MKRIWNVGLVVFSPQQGYTNRSIMVEAVDKNEVRELIEMHYEPYDEIEYSIVHINENTDIIRRKS